MMNRESNSYTFIYASALVVVVATLLSITAIKLKPRQDENIRVAKMIDILKSVNIASTADDATTKYKAFIKETFIVNTAGQKMEGEAFEVNMKEELTKERSQRQMPVYVCTLDNGEKKYILQVRGKGLWGPLWGYIAVNNDKTSIYGATFSHKSETPGLGAEIENDDFQAQFKEKKIMRGGNIAFEITKGGAKPGDDNAVDAISGGTITSKGVEDMLIDCLGAYESFLKQ